MDLIYNAALRPWFHLTPDLQILDPANHYTEPAILFGIRAGLSYGNHRGEVQGTKHSACAALLSQSSAL